jgi:putative ABC transport system permease protein
MKFLDSLQTALTSLKTNKTRSALTMLGIVIGISSVVAMVSLGSGAQSLITGQLVDFGSNTIFVEPGPWSEKMEQGTMMESMMEQFEIKTLTYEDAKAIEKLPLVESVAPAIIGIDRVVYKDISRKITFMGGTPSITEINGVYPGHGRMFTEDEIKSRARVAVLGHKIKQELFGDQEALGETIRIKKTNLRIVGVMEEQGMQMFLNLDDYIYIPLTTAQKDLLGISYVRWIGVKAVNEKVIDQAVDEIRLLLRQRHNINNPEADPAKDDFKVMSQKDTLKMLNTITSILTIFLSCVAAIALVVGGIGIMNIMLVSVTERTREIGLRKAVGARKKDILQQFLIEAMLLTIIGGVIGIIFGIVASYMGGIIIGNLLETQWVFSISIKAIAMAFGVSAAIGLVFGIFPARKAANLNPIEALRYE